MGTPDFMKVKPETSGQRRKKVQVTYDLDMFSIYGGFNSHLQVKGSAKVIKPVTWIRKVKGLSEVSNKQKG